LARGFRKNTRGGQRNTYSKYEKKTHNPEKKRRLDMGRDRYFRLDLAEKLKDVNFGEQSNTVQANITAKMSKHSFDEAVEYAKTVGKENSIPDGKIDELISLMRKYTKWR